MPRNQTWDKLSEMMVETGYWAIKGKERRKRRKKRWQRWAAMKKQSLKRGRMLPNAAEEDQCPVTAWFCAGRTPAVARDMAPPACSEWPEKAEEGKASRKRRRNQVRVGIKPSARIQRKGRGKRASRKPRYCIRKEWEIRRDVKTVFFIVLLRTLQILFFSQSLLWLLANLILSETVSRVLHHTSSSYGRALDWSFMAVLGPWLLAWVLCIARRKLAI